MISFRRCLFFISICFIDVALQPRLAHPCRAADSCQRQSLQKQAVYQLPFLLADQYMLRVLHKLAPTPLAQITLLAVMDMTVLYRGKTTAYRTGNHNITPFFLTSDMKHSKNQCVITRRALPDFFISKYTALLFIIK